MIESIKIKNFKALKELELDLSNLNILTGMNGMGKSSFIQVLLLLSQSYVQGSTSLDSLKLNGLYYNAGVGRDLLYQSAKNDIIEFLLKFSDNTILDLIVNCKPDYTNFQFEKPFQVYNNEINLFNAFNYLNVDHIAPVDITPKNNFFIENLDGVGIHGEYTIHYLSAKGNREINFPNMAHKKQKILLLHRQVESWLSEISPGVIVDFMEQPTRDSFLSFFKFNIKDGLTNNIRPQHVGFGISYALPTIVTLLSAKPDKLIILENPEAHLHPKGQSKIGEMMARAAQGEAQLIVETHSDHIINGVRVAVKEGKLDPEKVKIFYFDRNPDSKEHYSFVREMNIDADGRIDYWPEGFMDEWDKNLMELLK